MGLGVVDPLGHSPSAKWEIRISLILSERLQRAALELLSGKQVVASDNKVQITWRGDGAFRGILRLRDANPRIRFLLEIVLEALHQEEIDELDSPDPAGVVSHVPGAWMTVVSETSQTWELFNCRIESVIPVEA